MGWTFLSNAGLLLARASMRFQSLARTAWRKALSSGLKGDEREPWVIKGMAAIELAIPKRACLRVIFMF